jgi:hypothetical protein
MAPPASLSVERASLSQRRVALDDDATRANMDPVSPLTSLVYRWLARPLCLACLAGSAPGAGAAPEPAGFVWEAPRECPRRSLVLQHLADVLGFASTASAEPLLARARARGSIQREGERWVLELEVRDERGPKLRRLEADQCADLAHAAALALALLLNEAASSKGNPPAANPNAAAAAPAPRSAAMPPLANRQGPLAAR